MENEKIIEKIRGRKVGIALGSGGAKGISHIGVLEVLTRSGIKIEEVSGCSIGSIIGALFAAGVSFEKMKELAFGINIRNLWKIFDFTLPASSGFVKGKAVEKLLAEVLPVRKFEDLQIPFKCVAADVLTGEQVVFSSGDLIPAIRASISIPGFFVHYEYQNHILVDGGIVNPLPIDLLTDSEFKIAVMVDDYRILKKFLKSRLTLKEKIEKHLFESMTPIVKNFSERIKKNDESEKSEQHKKNQMNFLGILSHSIDNMTQKLLKNDLSLDKADLIINPDVRKIPILAFHEGWKSYVAGIEAAEKILKMK
ncbi:MAG: hypothetical protein B6D62_03720 [Candidatus Cloacimonas sp. 4484_275]|nr:MAG: hypothetical protein B6D62_03720 [Candidatus Cloacimonas sp. 4484_275]RLC51418.1 MAG: hypothetical protein DRZ79_02790 [Candidatus Cloacimonadota bacterium]